MFSFEVVNYHDQARQAFGVTDDAGVPAQGFAQGRHGRRRQGRDGGRGQGSRAGVGDLAGGFTGQLTADGGFVTTSETSPFRFRLIPCAETGTPPCASCGCATAPQRPLPVALLMLAGLIGATALRRRK